ncbi:peptidase family M3-domain-containing protein [Neohortaea acidophila]|uniref:Peptidase family M3-domain-containing protein n=1 Tax=Neohortaea acidophila TaxID=245834 RepID=A0A6A6PYN6_9PEZI|nr:peptidase family M3-domain-containing protein [Neohortaea acidophila]KAF2484871.1 peptidase family M3-domain-containing protein [Neohortaea acidophila]
MAPQKLKKPPQSPPLFTHTPQGLMESTQRLLDRNQALQDRVVKDVSLSNADFKNVLLPFAQDTNEMSLESHIVGFYQAVSTDPALRDASTEAEKKMDDFFIESSMRDDIFQLVDAAFKKQKDDQSLDAESRRLLEKEHKDYIKMGLGIPQGPDRDRFKAIKKRLSDLSITFQKNLNEEQGGLWLAPEELEGVPQDVIEGLKKGENENAGKLWLTFKYPDYLPLQKYCKNAETRHKVFIANENKCNQNVELFKEALILRDEAARLLGYPNHATFRVEDKMAKTPKTVDDFLGDLRVRLAPAGLKEIEALKKLKQDETGSADNYFLWDYRFYDTLMLERYYQLDQNRIAEYFPLSTSIEGMLNIFEQLFGLVFVRVEGKDRADLSETGRGEDIVWHPDVHLFSVWDDEEQGSEFVGYLYLDLHPRDGKYGHAANFNIQPGFINANGTRRYPATALVCNFSKATPKKPSLLKHDEVVTLFHELGHGIHDLVSKTTYSRFHGTSVVRDFVEAPSQMLENWCWTPSQLRSLSKHWSYLTPEYREAWKASAAEGEQQPPEQMPDDLIQSVVRTQHVNDAIFNLRQLHFGIFDMTVHEPSSHAAITKLDASATFNRLRKDISKMDGPEVLGANDDWGHGEATFGHLIGGYDAGYYGYLSSQVYSADMFYSVFKKDPMNGKEGRRYRHTVLEKGGSQDEMQTLEEFLGRKPSPEAFYKELGIA